MSMEWTSTKQDELYTSIQGDCRALVWCSSPGDWMALVSRAGRAVGDEHFTHREAAWTWCETRIAALQRGR